MGQLGSKRHLTCPTLFWLQKGNYEAQGHLAGDSASLLMKLLWLARLSRPDLSFSIVSLAASITRWSRNYDMKLKRIIGYLKHTTSMGLWGSLTAGNPSASLKLYCDADLVTCKSHSGIFLALETEPGVLFPLSWGSKRQTAVARSNGEAEFAAANESVFQEAIPVKSLLETILGVQIPTTLLEDNQACIAVIQAGFSPKLRSMSRTHRTSIAALSEAVKLN